MYLPRPKHFTVVYALALSAQALISTIALRQQEEQMLLSIVIVATHALGGSVANYPGLTWSLQESSLISRWPVKETLEILAGPSDIPKYLMVEKHLQNQL